MSDSRQSSTRSCGYEFPRLTTTFRNQSSLESLQHRKSLKPANLTGSDSTLRVVIGNRENLKSGPKNPYIDNRRHEGTNHPIARPRPIRCESHIAPGQECHECSIDPLTAAGAIRPS